ncbi:TPA: phage tail tip lysozyme [Streptococcus agalactiae]
MGTVLLFPFFIIILIVMMFSAGDSNCDVSENDVSVSTQNETTSQLASSTDPFKSGTLANKNAKYVFDSFIHNGVTGAYAAGIVGWVNSEGGFSMIGRAEGHFGNDLNTNSLSKGVLPSVMSGYPIGKSGRAEGGGGIFQFTPFSKFAPLGSSDWENAEKQVNFVIKSISGGDWNASMDLSGGRHSFQEAVKLTDPKKSSLTWQAYERGSVAHINQNQKQADAQRFFDLFDGAKYSYNANKFQKAFGNSVNNTNNVSVSSSDDSDSFNSCDDSISVSGSWASDGSGEVHYRDLNAWRPNELPKNLKQYAIDPKSVGLSYRNNKGWDVIAWSGGQCTDLSASLMNAIWNKKGSKPVQKKGNGSDVVFHWARFFGGKISKKPKAGSVFSQTSTSAGGVFGHTGVVSHVFENGDILVVEQNFADFSGEHRGFGKYTWNYRYVTKGAISSGYTFYDPSQSGYQISPKLKTVA